MANSRYTDRRTVLKTAGGLLGGAPMLTGHVTADEIKPQNDVRLNIRNGAVTPEIEVLTAEVRIPGGPGEIGAPDTFHLGVLDGTNAFPDGPVLYINDTGKFAQPVRVQECPGTGGPVSTVQWLMQFPVGAIDFSRVGDAVGAKYIEMVLAIPGSDWAPDSTNLATQAWDTDMVRMPISFTPGEEGTI